MTHYHQAVMPKEAIQGLNINPKGIYVDATFGRGGHSQSILEQLQQDGRLLAFDKDLTAINFGKAKFAKDPRITWLHTSFNNLQEHLESLDLFGKVNGILFDLGVSSPQLADPSRGFSFQHDGPLDMRMDQHHGLKLSDWLNSASEAEIARVIRTYGQERAYKRVAKAIVLARTQQPILTTLQLANICKQHIVTRGRHPATKVFQALRIQINQELVELLPALTTAFNSLSINGRLVAISFHSLEDRLVKQFMQQQAVDQHSPKLPIKHTNLNIPGKILGKKIRPSLAEVANNPRSRSATMRILEKIC